MGLVSWQSSPRWGWRWPARPPAPKNRRAACRHSRSIRSGRSSTGTGSLARSAACSSTQANDHVWVLQRPNRLENDENYAAQKPPVADCCVPAPAVMEFDPNGKFIKGWGGPGTRLRVAAERARPVHRPQGQLLDRRERQRRRPGPEVQQGRESSSSRSATSARVPAATIWRTSPGRPRRPSMRRRTKCSFPTGTTTGA